MRGLHCAMVHCVVAKCNMAGVVHCDEAEHAAVHCGSGAVCWGPHMAPVRRDYKGSGDWRDSALTNCAPEGRWLEPGLPGS